MPSFETVSTPNPDSLKFVAQDFTYLDSGMFSASSEGEAAGNPLATALIGISGVANVFIVPAFLTVTKLPGASWDDLVPVIEAALRRGVRSSE